MALLQSLNLRSKLILAMMLAAALTGLTQAWLGNSNVSRGFEERIESRLSALALISAKRVETYFENARATVGSLATDLMAIDALAAFDTSIKQISSESLTDEIEVKLQAYYAKEYVPRLVKANGAAPLVGAYIPRLGNARYLQYQYIAANPAPSGRKFELQSAPDGSAYSVAHARFHPPLRAIQDNHGFADLLLINADGIVVYSTMKEIDFMSNLVDGAFNDSGLAKAFNMAKRDRGTRPIVFQDFSFYQPSFGAPSFFVATPVFSGREFKGVVAAQLSADKLNGVVNNGRDWRAAGLGDAGDIFVVGSDGLLRTTVRKFEEKPDEFLAAIDRGGTTSVVIEQIKAFKTPIMLENASNRLVPDAKKGSTVAQVVRDFEGRDARSVVTPLNIEGLDWNVVAEIPLAEANKPVVDFQRLMMLALALTVAATTIGAMMLSGWIVRPLRALAGRLSAAAQGDLDTQIKLPHADEIGDVSASGQLLVDNFRGRLSEAEEARKSTHDLLSRFLPDGIVRLITSRYKVGSDEDDLSDVSEVVPNATFVVGKLSGYEGMLASLPPADAVRALDQLVQVVDVAADKLGVEKVRTAGDTYFAVSGLSTPHIDHRQRGLAFALDLHGIVERFRRDNDVNLQIKIGIASGSAVSGVIGRQKLAFDIWGQPVGECEFLSAIAAPGEIRVTQEFAEKMKDTHAFVPSADPDKPGFLLASAGARSGGATAPEREQRPAKKKPAARKAKGRKESAP